MVEAKEGKIDTEYFQNMIQNKEVTEYKRNPSGRGRSSYKVDHLSGWFLNFFAYWEDGKDYEIFDKGDIGVKDFNKIPSQMLIVPFTIIDRNKNEYFMKYKVGFVGCDQNEKKEVYPVTGWIVSPSTEKERNSLI